MRSGRLVGALVGLAALGVVSVSGQPAGGAAAVEVAAVARADEDLSLGFTISGRVAAVLVEPGDRVEAGGVLVRLDDRLARVDEAVAALAAESSAGEDVATARLELLRAELRRVEEARERDAAALFELERKQLEVEQAGASLRVEQAARRGAALGLERASAVVAEHELRSPIAGVVETVAVGVGEPVEALKPVVRVVRERPLRVDAAVPAWRTLTLEAGDSAWIRGVGEGVPWAEGRVASLSALSDAASETRVVRVMVDGLRGAGGGDLPAGSRVVVRFVEPD